MCDGLLIFCLFASIIRPLLLLWSEEMQLHIPDKTCFISYQYFLLIITSTLFNPFIISVPQAND